MKKSIPRIFIIICLLFTIAASGILYRSSFSAYFFQDDWFTLRISQAETIGDFLAFFIPRTDIIYYRPLGMQVPFFILRTFFGLDPRPFHLLTFITHSINIVLVFVLIKLLVKDSARAILVSFLYGTSLIHYIPFFWPSTYPFVAGPTMFFTSFILFLLSFKKGFIYYLFSVVVFFLGLFFNEMVSVLPVILLFYVFIFDKRKYLKAVLPYIVVFSLYFFFRFYFYMPPATGVYEFEANKALIANLKAYFLWSFNLPEEIKAQFVTFFTLNPQFIKDFYSYFVIFTISLLTSFFFFYVLPVFLLLIKYISANKKQTHIILYGILWFLTGILPVIFFPSHTFSYYLPISHVGLMLFSSSMIAMVYERLIKENDQKSIWYIFLLLSIICFNWLLVGISTYSFNSKIHWAPRRAKIAEELAKKVRSAGSSYNRKVTVYLPGGDENRLSLNNQDGAKVILGRDDVETEYLGKSNK